MELLTICGLLLLNYLNMQSLFTENKASRFELAPIGKVQISKHNPRKQRDKNHIDGIAQSISDNGYDNAYPIKCHLEGNMYAAFAGGTRLTACQMIGLETVPVLVYEGYSDAEIWAMAYKDQEQGKTQKQFSIVDVWLDYAAKAEQGFTQLQIAKSLNLGEAIVNYRIKLARLPVGVLGKILTNEVLNERVCRELLQSSPGEDFYLPYDTTLIEIIDNVLARTKEPTAKIFEAEVSKYNSLIACFDANYKDLPDFKDEFKQELADKGIRSEGEIKSLFNKYLKKVEQKAKQAENEKLAQLTKLEQERINAERAAAKATAQNVIFDRIANEDCVAFFAGWQGRVKVVLTDPPYGMDFQSNRRTATNKLSKIENDADLGTALQLCENVFSVLFSKMETDATLFCFCTWKNEFEFRQMIERVGFVVKGSLIWVKPNHGTGDLKGTFAPKHERIIHAVKGNPTLNKRLPDVLNGSAFLDTLHPTPKPIDLLKSLIECCSQDSDFIADPFLGCGSTAVSALSINRNFVGSEIDKGYYGEALTNVLKLIENENIF